MPGSAPSVQAPQAAAATEPEAQNLLGLPPVLWMQQALLGVRQAALAVPLARAPAGCGDLRGPHGVPGCAALERSTRMHLRWAGWSGTGWRNCSSRREWTMTLQQRDSRCCLSNQCPRNARAARVPGVRCELGAAAEAASQLEVCGEVLVWCFRARWLRSRPPHHQRATRTECRGVQVYSQPHLLLRFHFTAGLVRPRVAFPMLYPGSCLPILEVTSMMRFSPIALARQAISADAVAHSQRSVGHLSDQPGLIAVAALNDQILTTPTTALVAVILHAATRLPMIAIDGDGVNQPLRGPLGAGGGGDLVGLANVPSRGLRRAQIEPFADYAGAVPLLSAARQSPQPVDTDTLVKAVDRASHRWPVAVVDLPFTCRPDVIAAGTSLATHILLVADKHHGDHSWLYRSGHHLSAAAQEQRVTVVKVGAEHDDSLPPDTLTLPAATVNSSARERMPVSFAPEAVIQYNRLLARLFPVAEE